MNSNRAVVLLISLLMTTALGAEPDRGASRHSCCASVGAGPGLLTDKSRYQLDSTWTDDQGRAVKLATLRGRPQIVCMFFASCQYACPLLVAHLKQIEGALPENLRTNTGFVLVSFDTERDTAEVLHRYGLSMTWRRSAGR